MINLQYEERHQQMKDFEPFWRDLDRDELPTLPGHAETYANHPLEEVLCAQCFQEAQFWRQKKIGC